MKKTLGTLRLSAIVCCLAVMVACSNDDTPIVPEPQKQHTEAVSELIRLLNGNPEVKALLEKSITKAAKVNPDRRYNPRADAFGVLRLRGLERAPIRGAAGSQRRRVGTTAIIILWPATLTGDYSADGMARATSGARSTSSSHVAWHRQSYELVLSKLPRKFREKYI